MKMMFEHFIQRATTEDPFFKFMQFKVEHLEPGCVELKFFIDPNFHTNRMGICHGGPLAALSDTCMGWSCRTLGLHVVTINISISYARPVQEGGWVRGKGVVIYRGTNTIVAEVNLYDEGDKLLVSGKGRYWIKDEIDLEKDI